MLVRRPKQIDYRTDSSFSTDAQTSHLLTGLLRSAVYGEHNEVMSEAHASEVELHPQIQQTEPKLIC